MPTSSSSCSRHLVRFPAFFLIYLIVAIELICYIWIRFFIFVYEKLYLQCRSRASDSGKSLQKWEELQTNGSTYRKWFRAASELDTALGMSVGKLDHNIESDACVLKLSKRLRSGLFGRTNHNTSRCMKQLTKESVKFIIADLKMACSPHLGSVGTSDSYRWNYKGQNQSLNQFSTLTEQALIHVVRSRDVFQGQDGPNKRLRLFTQLKNNYGTTALCMSGGAANGYFHLGMVSALLKYDMLPNIITGSSAGSLIASVVASRTNAELDEFLNQDRNEIASLFQPIEGNIFTWLINFLKTGAAVDPKNWPSKLERLMAGNWTFEEAWQRTGRDLFICVYSDAEQTRVLNWRTTPKVTIASAVIASSALPNIMHGQSLQIKNADGTIVNEEGSKFFDGSLKHDVPLDHLNTHFSNLNCRYTIVSQVEPHILPFFYCPQGSPGNPEIARRGDGLKGGFMLSLAERFLKLDMQKYLALIRDFRINVRAISEFDDAFLQKTWGDCTIRPEMNFSDYFAVFSNPTGKSMEAYIQRGRTATYKHLCMISHRHKLEQCLQTCCREASAAVVDRSSARLAYHNDPTNTRSIHEVVQLERECDLKTAQLELALEKSERLQTQLDEVALKCMKMEADEAAISSMMVEDTSLLRQRRASSISPTKQRRDSKNLISEELGGPQ